MNSLALSCSLSILCCLAPCITSQSPPPQPPDFEVASIHQNTSSAIRWRIEFTPDGFIAEDALLSDIIYEAWGSDSLLQWDPLPVWTLKTRFDIAARFDAVAFTHPSRAQREAMLQSLLVYRFHLQFHRESRDFPLLALTVASTHPKLQESTPSEVLHDPVDGHPICYFASSRRGHVKMEGCTLTDLARRLSSHWDTGLDQVVVDHTGLRDRYDLELSWRPPQAAIGSQPASPEPLVPSGVPDPDSPAPEITAALWQQLGLKLVRTHGPLDVFIVDHIEMPTSN